MILSPDQHALLRSRYNPDGSPMRALQMRLLDILLEVDDICRRHNIPYWLSSGTLLGAARHGGFIPWDDDVDIEMLAPDYRRFCSVAPRELPPHLRLHNSGNDPMFMLGFSKVRDTRFNPESSDAILDGNLAISGYFIDVFSLEPSSSLLLHRASGKLAYWGMLAVNRSHSRPWGKIVRALYDGLTGVLRLINRASGALSSGQRLRHSFPSTFYKARLVAECLPLSTITFEGHNFPAPHDTDAYLRRLYGDWKALPSTPPEFHFVRAEERLTIIDG